MRDGTEDRKIPGWLTTVILVLVAVFSATDASAADRARKKVSRDELGQGFAIGSGQPSLALKVDLVDGKVVSAAPADAASANVFAERSNGEKQTMLNLHTSMDVALKFDLYLSRDGQIFEYTSTCAVTPGISGFEMWPYPVREFALGNPRVLPEGKMTCE